MTPFALVAMLLFIPAIAQAGGIPFFGPVIDKSWIVSGTGVQCALGWGALIMVINNVISLLLTLAIVFVLPLMIAWAGFMYVLNPISPEKRSAANKMLGHAIVGIVIALAGWLIVNAIMAALYNPKEVGKTWSQLVTTGGQLPCLPQKGVGTGLTKPPPPTVTPEGPTTPGPGRFTYDNGISAQIPTASAALSSLLTCMAAKVPAGVGRISSISDSRITSGQKTFAQCAGGGCAHAAGSCHYGGKTCVGSSYAVDFGDEQNAGALTVAAQACGATYIANEGNHLHVSVGKSCGCN